MSDYWLGVLTVPVVLVFGALALTISALLLEVWFRYGVGLLKLLPQRMDSDYRKSLHAAVMATCDRGARLFWIAGFGVYVIQHGRLERSDREYAKVQQTILERLRELRDVRTGRNSDV